MVKDTESVGPGAVAVVDPLVVYFVRILIAKGIFPQGLVGDLMKGNGIAVSLFRKGQYVPGNCRSVQRFIGRCLCEISQSQRMTCNVRVIFVPEVTFPAIFRVIYTGVFFICFGIIPFCPILPFYIFGLLKHIIT